MRPPLNHMMLHEDVLADEFDAIVNYRVMHAGLVLPGGGGDYLLMADGVSVLLMADGTSKLKRA